MTPQELPQLGRPAAAVWDPIGTKLEDVAREWAVACLLEDPHGRVVCHALVPGAPAAAVDAVIARSSSPLHRAATKLRAAGQRAGSPLLTGSVDGWEGTATVIPLAGAGHLWVFGRQALRHQQLEAMAEDLTGLLHRMQDRATEPGLYDRLHGLGADVAGLDNWVAVLRESAGRDLDPLAVHRILGAALARCPGLEVTATHTTAFVLLRDPDPVSAHRRVDSALHQLSERLQLSVVAALAPSTSGLHRAREAAERALSAHAVPGRCVSVDEARSYETLHRVLDAVRTMPPLDRDPLNDLIDAGEPMLTTLRAWLDLHGDIPAAAERLGVHVNTLRYRMKRATSLMAADLRDPVARLEVHLRLLALDARDQPQRATNRSAITR